jgi:hypothetical protein
MKYTVTLIMTRYLKVGEEWQDVDVKRAFTFTSWDDVQALIGCLVEGASGAVKFEIEATTVEEA